MMNKTAIVGFSIGVVLFIVVVGGYLTLGVMSRATNVAITKSEEREAPVTPAATQTTQRTQRVLPQPEPDDAQLSLVRTVETAAYAPGAPIEVTITIEGQHGDKVRALGLIENVPEGWTFDDIVAGDRPDLSPPQGRGALLEFAWFNIPEFPTTFTYRVNTTSGDAAPQTIKGEILFRTHGPEYRSKPVATVLAPDAKSAGAPAPAKASQTAAAARPETGEPLAIARSVSGGGYVPGETLEATITLTYGRAQSDPVTAIAVVEVLPEGWTFESVSGSANPTLAPQPGATGEINFIWVTPPQWPATFTYRVRVPENESGARALSGHSLYRTSGGELRTPPALTEMTAAVP